MGPRVRLFRGRMETKQIDGRAGEEEGVGEEEILSMVL